MKKAIVFSSGTGNTEKLANKIQSLVGETMYMGKPSEEALEADVIFLGSWAMAFTCTPDIKEFAEKLNNKKVFLFMTAGYDQKEEFFTSVMDAFKANINDSNEVVGTFICAGKVSEAKKAGLVKLGKFEQFEAGIAVAESHPDDADLAALAAKVQEVL